MSKFEHILDDSKSRLTLTIGENTKTVVTMEAQDLEGLIRYLANIRRDMQPAIQPVFLSDGNFDAVFAPPFAVGENADIGVVMHLLEPGIGWLNFILPAAQATEMARILKDQAKKVPEDAMAKLEAAKNGASAPSTLVAANG